MSYPHGDLQPYISTTNIKGLPDYTVSGIDMSHNQGRFLQKPCRKAAIELFTAKKTMQRNYTNQMTDVEYLENHVTLLGI